jgi:hypothetical protein
MPADDKWLVDAPVVFISIHGQHRSAAISAAEQVHAL